MPHRQASGGKNTAKKRRKRLILVAWLDSIVIAPQLGFSFPLFSLLNWTEAESSRVILAWPLPLGLETKKKKKKSSRWKSPTLSRLDRREVHVLPPLDCARKRSHYGNYTLESEQASGNRVHDIIHVAVGAKSTNSVKLKEFSFLLLLLLNSKSFKSRWEAAAAVGTWLCRCLDTQPTRLLCDTSRRRRRIGTITQSRAVSFTSGTLFERALGTLTKLFWCRVFVLSSAEHWTLYRQYHENYLRLTSKVVNIPHTPYRTVV